MQLTPRLWKWDAQLDADWLAGCSSDMPLVWQAELTDEPATRAHLTSLISPEERARMERLRVHEDQLRFLIGRGLLRILTGSHLKMPPERVKINTGPFGKPSMSPCPGGATVHFNVSHSGKLVLLAFHPVHEVGVDVEAVREDHDWETVAERIFSADKYHELLRLNPAERLGAFFQAWTCHEARLKTLGQGFSDESSLTPDTRFACFELALPEGYRGAAGCLR